MDTTNMHKRVILWSSLLLWITLAIFLSRQTGAETTSLSLRLAKSIIDFFLLNIDLYAFHLLLRKAAHIGIYLVTGVLMAGACIATFPRKAAFIIALLFTAALSVLDELQKIHIEGRHCQWDEVGLNMFSAVIGIGIVLLACCRKKQRAKLR
jgi:VanZ family protein